MPENQGKLRANTRNFQFFLDGIVLLVQRDAHGAGQAFRRRRQKDIFDHAPDGGKGIQLGNIFAV